MMSPAHWVIVVFIILLLFGTSKIASVGKGLGEGIRNFKKGIEGLNEEEEAKAKQIPAKNKETGNA